MSVFFQLTFKVLNRKLIDTLVIQIYMSNSERKYQQDRFYFHLLYIGFSSSVNFVLLNYKTLLKLRNFYSLLGMFVEIWFSETSKCKGSNISDSHPEMSDVHEHVVSYRYDKSNFNMIWKSMLVFVSISLLNKYLTFCAWNYSKTINRLILKKLHGSKFVKDLPLLDQIRVNQNH